jgi:hypothetical protein
VADWGLDDQLRYVGSYLLGLRPPARLCEMTSLAKRKSRLVIQTEDCIRERGKLREVQIEAHPYYATVKLKGMRVSYQVSWASVYGLAVKQAVEAARREKKTQKARK